MCKNQKSFKVLDRFPHVMSLNLVLRGEQYYITSNFKSNETALHSHPLNDWKMQLPIDKLIPSGVSNYWR